MKYALLAVVGLALTGCNEEGSANHKYTMMKAQKSGGVVRARDQSSAPARESDEEIIDLALSKVKATLRDPNSAEFSEIAVYRPATMKPFVCGIFNARNGFGGMAGRQKFIVQGDDSFTEEDDKVIMDFKWKSMCEILGSTLTS